MLYVMHVLLIRRVFFIRSSPVHTNKKQSMQLFANETHLLLVILVEKVNFGLIVVFFFFFFPYEMMQTGSPLRAY